MWRALRVACSPANTGLLIRGWTVATAARPGRRHVRKRLGHAPLTWASTGDDTSRCGLLQLIQITAHRVKR